VFIQQQLLGVKFPVMKSNFPPLKNPNSSQLAFLPLLMLHVTVDDKVMFEWKEAVGDKHCITEYFEQVIFNNRSRLFPWLNNCRIVAAMSGRPLKRQ